MTTFFSQKIFDTLSPLPVKMASLLAATTVMTGCATLGGGLTATQCQQRNWQAIGYQDGLMGRGQDYLQKHVKQCAQAKASATPSQNATPNQALWEKGRQEGLTRYCTPLRAYQLGREGYEYNDVCPPAMTLDLLKAHDEGYLNYQREQTLNQLWYNDDPFWDSPFYGRFGGFGGRSPLYYPRLVPNNPYPRYIDNKSQTQKQAVTPTSDAKTGVKN